ncbi:ubiquitin fusion degradation protein UFD1CY [Cardiosporidium cionae]|uniref:Ubiquitin fusion degradation protein UFD1CY n=1 Tax=Cardiosporidium cionae TaxID=476202 RepID=A0ABQ7J820_9APIC|nr:ubiquitin fusion degradation protein UFD1CY [Cardiosporidium cionae]|eukprot:KAF8820138.1 ubiquitin fusion degradation protein UFD1CY [Cardiosporidium cionae]
MRWNWQWGMQAASNALRGELSNQSSPFNKEYRCYSVSFMARDDMEKGNKILLPQSALHLLARLNISWPMLFEISNAVKDRTTHSGVLEFIADEGCCFMPYWMMQNLLLKEGDIVRVRNISLPKGTYVKLQPVTFEFSEISNPKAVLENALRNYATLTVGDNIVIQYLDKAYEIEVVELKPASAITIIETDVEVEFQYPQEYSTENTEDVIAEDDDLKRPPTDTTKSSSSSILFDGIGQRLDGKTPRSFTTKAESLSSNKNTVEDTLPWTQSLPRGVRRRLKTYDAVYEKLLHEGRIPGVVGKIKRSNSRRETFNPEENFKLFGGQGHELE